MLRQKRGNYVAAIRGMGSKQIQDSRCQPGDFEFDVEESGGLVALQDIAQKRQPQLLGRAVINFEAVNRGVVADHRVAIGGESYVKLKPIASLGECPIKRSNRNFRE